MSSLHEECGIFGVYSPVKQDVARTAYYGLFALQHRGQESCGIVVCDDGVFSRYKDLGLVEEVFGNEEESIPSLSAITLSSLSPAALRRINTLCANKYIITNIYLRILPLFTIFHSG